MMLGSIRRRIGYATVAVFLALLSVVLAPAPAMAESTGNQGTAESFWCAEIARNVPDTLLKIRWTFPRENVGAERDFVVQPGRLFANGTEPSLLGASVDSRLAVGPENRYLFQRLAREPQHMASHESYANAVEPPATVFAPLLKLPGYLHCSYSLGSDFFSLWRLTGGEGGGGS